MASSSAGSFPLNTSLLRNREQKRALQAPAAPTTSSSFSDWRSKAALGIILSIATNGTTPTLLKVNWKATVYSSVL